MCTWVSFLNVRLQSRCKFKLKKKILSAPRKVNGISGRLDGRWSICECLFVSIFVSEVLNPEDWAERSLAGVCRVGVTSQKSGGCVSYCYAVRRWSVPTYKLCLWNEVWDLKRCIWTLVYSHQKRLCKYMNTSMQLERNGRRWLMGIHSTQEQEGINALLHSQSVVVSWAGVILYFCSSCLNISKTWGQIIHPRA